MFESERKFPRILLTLITEFQPYTYHSERGRIITYNSTRILSRGMHKKTTKYPWFKDFLSLKFSIKFPTNMYIYLFKLPTIDREVNIFSCPRKCCPPLVSMECFKMSVHINKLTCTRIEINRSKMMTREYFELFRSKCRFHVITDNNVHHDKEAEELNRTTTYWGISSHLSMNVRLISVILTSTLRVLGSSTCILFLYPHQT